MNVTFLLPVHIVILLYVAWNILLADHLGFTWVTGKVHTLKGADIRRYHKRVWIGLIGMIITGFLMFLPLREFLLTRPQFYVKMAFVLALVINGLVIGRLQKIALEKSFAELTMREKIPLFISGAVSTLSWIGAALGGFYLMPY